MKQVRCGAKYLGDKHSTSPSLTFRYDDLQSHASTLRPGRLEIFRLTYRGKTVKLFPQDLHVPYSGMHHWHISLYGGRALPSSASKRGETANLGLSPAHRSRFRNSSFDILAYPACPLPLQTALTSLYSRYGPGHQLHRRGYISEHHVFPSVQRCRPTTGKGRWWGGRGRAWGLEGGRRRPGRKTDRNRVTKREARWGER